MPDANELSIGGYKFVGWATLSNAKEEQLIYVEGTNYDTESRLASKKEGVLGAENDNEIYKLYALWMKNPYTVNYDVNNDESATSSVASQRFVTDSDQVQN